METALLFLLLASNLFWLVRHDWLLRRLKLAEDGKATWQANFREALGREAFATSQLMQIQQILDAKEVP